MSGHTTEDLLEAATRVQRAVDAHRRAHDVVEGAVDLDPSSVVDETAVLREAMAECRRQCKQAEKVRADSRARLAAASSAIQSAVQAARREQGK